MIKDRKGSNHGYDSRFFKNDRWMEKNVWCNKGQGWACRRRWYVLHAGLSHPVVSLFFVTGEEKDHTTGKKHVHMHYSRQDESYPKIVESTLEMETMGFKLYKNMDRHNDMLNMTAYKKNYTIFFLILTNPLKRITEWSAMKMAIDVTTHLVMCSTSIFVTY